MKPDIRTSQPDSCLLLCTIEGRADMDPHVIPCFHMCETLGSFPVSQHTEGIRVKGFYFSFLFLIFARLACGEEGVRHGLGLWSYHPHPVV